MIIKLAMMIYYYLYYYYKNEKREGKYSNKFKNLFNDDNYKSHKNSFRKQCHKYLKMRGDYAK